MWGDRRKGVRLFHNIAKFDTRLESERTSGLFLWDSIFLEIVQVIASLLKEHFIDLGCQPDLVCSDGLLQSLLQRYFREPRGGGSCNLCASAWWFLLIVLKVATPIKLNLRRALRRSWRGLRSLQHWNSSWVSDPSCSDTTLLSVTSMARTAAFPEWFFGGDAGVLTWNLSWCVDLRQEHSWPGWIWQKQCMSYWKKQAFAHHSITTSIAPTQQDPQPPSGLNRWNGSFRPLSNLCLV